MNFFSFAFCCILLLSACSAPDKGKEQAAVKNSTVVSTENTILLPGLWVNKRYVDAIIKTGSPLQSQSGNEESCIYIPEKTGAATCFIFGFHDGGEALVLTKNGADYYLKSAQGNAQNLKIEILDSTKIKIDKNIFVFAGRQNPDSDYKILEKFLFWGKYTMADKTIEFKENGELTGFPMLDEYKPTIDYSGDEGTPDFDEIEFLNNHRPVLKMGFKFKNDSLILYKTSCPGLSKYDSINKICDNPVMLSEVLYRLKKADEITK